MPYDELIKWQKYFQLRPEGWREDNRTYTLLKVQGVKAKPDEIFSSLAPIMHPPSLDSTIEKRSSVGFISKDSLQRSFIFNKMFSATGGDDIREILSG